MFMSLSLLTILQLHCLIHSVCNMW